MISGSCGETQAGKLTDAASSLCRVQQSRIQQPSTQVDDCWRIRFRSSKMLIRISAAVELLVATFLPAQELPPMSKWPIGVFTSIDDGLGVHLDVVKELQIPTVHLHCPLPENRTEDHARAYLDKAADAGFEATVLFSGFAGETYESIQRTAETVGIVPEGLRDARAAARRHHRSGRRPTWCGR